MQIELFSIASIQGFLVCAARVTSLFSALPIFGSAQTPVRIRIALSVTIALVVYPLLPELLPATPLTPIGLGILIAQETMVGLMIGFIARLVFIAVEFGGSIIGYQMGFAAANVFDPQSQHQVSLISQFQNVFAILLFLAFDVHHLFLRLIADSYRLLPAGDAKLGGEAVLFLSRLTGEMFTLAVKFSAPVLIVLLLSGLVLGIMSRMFQQLNAFMLSFPINIGVSFLSIGLTMQLLAVMLQREFGALQQRFYALLDLL
ncbi:flagellar biogenesis protein FliR [Syntrophotalea carbinolica DSM 2380]|uniref:Flagellar biosynthetic protein FliR n=1 Tax=Syntrophotalea carbinolica (strain DSM 2380 / NBRC 103641 / GraBd1) TaxID=338963 RepID=Q3A5E4_SYNC1|nr:flagellar biosynthetic protein FliR [Syntrophotalea carbinolica]ABA88413.1 flagellar biogenesis protein FliR [Syntrophotalea carbinolica DSM 2380]